MSDQMPTDPRALRAEIARTRADLGATVEALAGRLDVRARARGAAAQAVDDVRAKAVSLRDRPPLAAIALAFACIGVVIYLIGRRRP